MSIQDLVFRFFAFIFLFCFSFLRYSLMSPMSIYFPYIFKFYATHIFHSISPSFSYSFLYSFLLFHILSLFLCINVFFLQLFFSMSGSVIVVNNMFLSFHLFVSIFLYFLQLILFWDVRMV